LSRKTLQYRQKLYTLAVKTKCFGIQLDVIPLKTHVVKICETFATDETFGDYKAKMAIVPRSRSAYRPYILGFVEHIRKKGYNP